MTPKKSKDFYEAVELDHLKSYREFRNTIVDKNVATISKRKKLNYIQRSTEFFSLQTNIINFLKYKKNKLQLFIFPYEWCKDLGVNIVLGILSHFLFSIVVCKLSLIRILRVFREIIKSYNSHNFNNSNAVYLFSIPNNTTNNLDSNNKYTLIGWLEKNLFDKETIFFHDNRYIVSAQKKMIFNTFLPEINNINMIKTIAKFFPYLLISLIKLFFGNWQDLYLADDYLLRALFKNSKKNFFKSYIFPWVGSQFCPSWTNVVIQENSKVYLLNYSASSEPHLDGKSRDEMLFRISNWENIIPFNKKFVTDLEKNITYPSNILKTPTVFFTHDGKRIEDYVKKDFISIFDISPTNPEFYIGFSSIADYLYSNEDKMIFYKNFFNDIIEIAKRLNYHIVLKQKRNDPRQTPAYNELLLNLQKQNNLIILPPTMSPYYVIDNSFASIAQPFTSVGFYNENNKNVAFYDPLQILTPKHQESKGTSLLIGKKNLDLWFKKIIKSN